MSRGGAAGWVKGGGVGTAGAAPTHPPRPGARRVRGGKVQAAGHTRRPDPRSGVGSRHTPRAGGGADRKCGDRPASAGASRLLPLPPRRTTPGSAVRHRQCGKGSGVGRVWVGGGQPKRKKPCRGGRCITHRRPLVVSTAPDSAPAVRNVLNIGWPSYGSLLARFATGPSLSTTTNDTGLAAGRTGVGGGYISTS